MADRFTLSGSYTTEGLSGEPSFEPAIAAQISEIATLVSKKVDDLPLTVDTAVAVDFGGLTEANVVILKSLGGNKVKALVTSADGTDQAIPFDTYLILMTEDVPITALSLTRLPGTATTVRVFLGEQDS